jgi:hypothetical protein
MKKILFFLLFASSKMHAQELFSFTEPASNMPAHSLGTRISNYLMNDESGSKYYYYTVPELMLGVNNKLMIHADGFFNNYPESFAAVGFGVYAKYRFLAKDGNHKHFRMAAFARFSFINNVITQEAIDLYGFNSGFQAGAVATQLLNKVALSASASYVHALNNGNDNKFPSTQSKDAANYTLSFGKLMLPKEYKNFNQTNINLLAEFLGQTLADGKSYLDIAPALQFIFDSQARVDIGYRQQLYSTIFRNEPDGFLIRFEYLFFNVIK